MEKKLRDWLTDKPREVAVAIAFRSALRAAPFLSRGIGIWPSHRNFDDDLTGFLRCYITSGVAPKSPTPEVRSAAGAAGAAAALAADAAAAAAADDDDDAAAFGADAAAFAAADAAADDDDDDAAADAAFAAGAAAALAADAAAVWKAVELDVAYFDDHGLDEIDGIMARPIWPDGGPVWLAKDTERFLEYLADKPELAFWGPWYTGMRDGKPPNWEMQEKIALIPDADWKKGAVHLAGLIEVIRQEYEAPKIAPEKLRTQAVRLLEQAAASELSALGLAHEIETALTEYAGEQGNELPDEFATLAMMPRTLRTIARAVQTPDASEERIAELEALVAQYAGEIQLLTDRLAGVKAGGFKKSFCEQAGKSLGDWKLYAAIIGGSYAILGGEMFGMTLNSLSGSAREVFVDQHGNWGQLGAATGGP